MPVRYAACRICAKNEISKVTNHISSKQVRAFSGVLKHVEGMRFMGLYGESVLNPEFIPTVRYLKASFPDRSIYLATNCYAVTPKTYEILQGKHFHTVLKNLTELQDRKARKGVKKPRVTISYALNKANIGEAQAMVDLAMERGVKHVQFYHYRDYGASEWSLDHDPVYANQRIDQIYDYARKKCELDLLPSAPPYFKTDGVESKEEQGDWPCYLPWQGLQLRSSHSHPDSHYLGCCNVFNAFLFNYKEHIARYGKVEFKTI